MHFAYFLYSTLIIFLTWRLTMITGLLTFITGSLWYFILFLIAWATIYLSYVTVKTAFKLIGSLNSKIVLWCRKTHVSYQA